MFQQKVYTFTVQIGLSTTASTKKGKVKEEAIHKGRMKEHQAYKAFSPLQNLK